MDPAPSKSEIADNFSILHLKELLLLSPLTPPLSCNITDRVGNGPERSTKNGGRGFQYAPSACDLMWSNREL